MKFISAFDGSLRVERPTPVTLCPGILGFYKLTFVGAPIFWTFAALMITLPEEGLLPP